jgi:hypothetical protein
VSRGRPHADRLALLEQVVRLLLDDPTLSANRIQLIVEARRVDTLRVVRAARALLAADHFSVSTLDAASPPSRFPNSQSGTPGGRS